MSKDVIGKEEMYRDEMRQEEMSQVATNNKESNNDEQRQAYYPQTGVAVTCRSFAEYVAMFALEDAELRRGPVLDAAGGASSFAAEARARGIRAAAADPRYALSPAELYEQSVEEIAASTAKIEKLKEAFDWTFYGSVEAHRANRERSLEAFRANYDGPEGRSTYRAAALPALPFDDESFALVLCSHFLFLYEEQFSYDFHRAAVKELYRLVAPGGELRIYPLHSLRFAQYERLDELLAELEAMGAVAETLPSRLPFIPGSTRLLRVGKPR